MPKILLLGASGLLGSHLSESILKKKIFELIATSRSTSADIQFDYKTKKLGKLLKRYRPDIIINCIAVTSDKSSTLNLLKINGILPVHLALLASRFKMRLVHISSNAVFSGASNFNSENSFPFPKTKYGISKLIGDLAMFGSLVIRTSFVGVSKNSRSSGGFLDDLINQPPNSSFYVQDNFTWNGITAGALSEFICTTIMLEQFPRGILHLGTVEKIDRAQLVKMLLKRFGRTDVSVIESQLKTKRNMSLDSTKRELISKIWNNSRYGTVPKINQIIQEIS